MADIDLGILNYKLKIDTSDLASVEKQLGTFSKGGTVQGNVSPGANVAAGGALARPIHANWTPGGGGGGGGGGNYGMGGAGGLMGGWAFAGAGGGGAGGIAAGGGTPAAAAGGMRSNRLFRLGMIGAYDLGRSLESVAQVGLPMPGQTAIQGIQRQQAAIQNMQGGFFGAIAGGLLNIADVASYSFGASTANPSRGFGILGKYSPYSARVAAIEAEVGIGTMTDRQGAIEHLADHRRGFIKDRAEISGIQDDNPFSRQRNDARADYLTFRQEQQDTADKLTGRMGAATVAGDQRAYDAASFLLGEGAKDAPEERNRAEQLMNARINRAKRDELVYDRRNSIATSAANDIGDLMTAMKPASARLRGMQSAYDQATASPAMMESVRQRETAEYRSNLRSFRAEYISDVRGVQVDGMGSLMSGNALGGSQENAADVLNKIADLLAQIERNQANAGGMTPYAGP